MLCQTLELGKEVFKVVLNFGLVLFLITFLNELYFLRGCELLFVFNIVSSRADVLNRFELATPFAPLLNDLFCVLNNLLILAHLDLVH